MDKVTILRIKMIKMSGTKLENVTKEYNMLLPKLGSIGMNEDHYLFKALFEINLEFWEYHDWQRERFEQCKDENLIDIELYKRNRYEHVMNDNRAKVKKEINMLTHSDIIEEKQFVSYQI